MSSQANGEDDEIPGKTTDSFTSRQWMYSLIIVLIGLAAWGGCTYYGYKALQSRARAASCPNDVWELYQALRTYAADHDGLVPPISRTRGNLMMDPDGFYPDYLTNSCWVQCEWSPARRRGEGTHKNDDLGVTAFNDDSFCYIPWVIRTEEEGVAFIEAYKTLDLENRDQDLVVTIDGKERVLPRIRIAEKLIDQNREYRGQDIPIIIEWPDLNHYGRTVVGSTGGFRRISDEFPMTGTFIAGLREIASLDRPVPE